MYIVIDKKQKNILSINYASIGANLSDEEVYPDYSPKTMKIIKTDEVIPAYFKINKKDEIEEISQIEQIQAGFLPFEVFLQRFGSTDSTMIEERIDDALKYNLINSIERCEQALQAIDNDIEWQISQKFKMSYELKLTKDYISWINDGRPENDTREAKYNEMQIFINSIKENFKTRKTKIKKIFDDFK